MLISVPHLPCSWRQHRLAEMPILIKVFHPDAEHNASPTRKKQLTAGMQIVNRIKEAGEEEAMRKSWRKHPCWRRKPLPDCPLCRGKGLVPMRFFSPCGAI